MEEQHRQYVAELNTRLNPPVIMMRGRPLKTKEKGIEVVYVEKAIDSWKPLVINDEHLTIPPKEFMDSLVMTLKDYIKSFRREKHRIKMIALDFEKGLFFWR